MFEDLSASAAVGERVGATTALSTTLHLAIVVLASLATRGAADAEPATPTVVHADPFLIVHPRAPQPSEVGGSAAPDVAAVPAPLLAPISLPVGLPPLEVDLGDRPPVQAMQDHDPFALRGAPLYAVPGDSIHPEAMVDVPVRRLSGPPPEYPGELRAAGIEGVVTMRMVVDTSGRVERGSIVVQGATHQAFEAAATAALVQSRFVPARLRGHPVRQLVQQTVRFQLDRP